MPCSRAPATRSRRSSRRSPEAPRCAWRREPSGPATRSRRSRRDAGELGADVVHVHNLFPNLPRPCCARREPRCPGRDDAAQLPPRVPRRHVPPRRPDLRGLPRTDALARRRARLLPRLPQSERSARHVDRAAPTARLVDRPALFVAVSAFVRDKLVQAGIDGPGCGSATTSPGRSRAARVPAHVPRAGTLSPEKGIDTLLRAWDGRGRLVIAGDGPERERLVATAPPGVEFLGAVGSDAVRPAGRSACAALPVAVVRRLPAGGGRGNGRRRPGDRKRHRRTSRARRP